MVRFLKEITYPVIIQKSSKLIRKYTKKQKEKYRQKIFSKTMLAFCCSAHAEVKMVPETGLDEERIIHSTQCRGG